MIEFSVDYRYGGSTYELRLKAESFEQARERVLVFKASKEDAPRIHCLGDATPTAQIEPEAQMLNQSPHESQTSDQRPTAL